MNNVATELANAPLPLLIENLGVGIARAQRALDRVSMDLAKELADTKVELGDTEYSLLSLGFTPTFYQYTDTIIEAKVAFSMTKSREFGASVSVSGGVNVGFAAVTASVSASYSQKYQYSAEGSSMVRTKLVTVPNPIAFEQRLRTLIDAELEDRRNTIEE